MQIRAEPEDEQQPDLSKLKYSYERGMLSWNESCCILATSNCHPHCDQEVGMFKFVVTAGGKILKACQVAAPNFHLKVQDQASSSPTGGI